MEKHFRRYPRRNAGITKNWKNQADQLAVDFPIEREQELLALTGLTPDHIRPWSLGWDAEAFTVALYDAAGVDVIGLLKWRADGWRFVEGRPGLLLPAEFTSIAPLALAGEALFVAVDPLDALVAHAARRHVIGVPLLLAGPFAIEFIKRQKPRTVTILTPADEGGALAAHNLLAAIRPACWSFTTVLSASVPPASNWGRKEPASAESHSQTKIAV